jgi:hypothetical protein
MRALYTPSEWPTLATFDLEAGKWVNICLVCHIDEYGNRKNFPTVGLYMDWLFTEFDGDIVFAHAGGHYDNRFIIAEAKDRGWDFRTAISGGTIVIATITSPSKTIRFGDSYRLMPDSLKNIGDTVELAKLDVNPNEITNLTPKEVLDYCYRDCEIVLKGLKLMREKLTGVGADFAFTLASIATRYLRRGDSIRFEEFTVKVNGKWEPHPNISQWDGPCEEAFHGGRTEMFRRSEYIDDDGNRQSVTFENIEWYDIVSSYPSAMREALPLYYLGFFTPPKNLKRLETFFDHCGITACTMFVPDAFITVLPELDAANGRLTFPANREITGNWTNIELQEAIKHGAEVRHIQGQWRFTAVPFLRKFVDTFYTLRQEAKDKQDVFGAYAYKILLNSCYGKLTETVHRRSFITAGEIARAKSSGGKVLATNTQGVFEVESDEVGPFRHTAAGAYVTAFARLRLFRMALEMHQKGAKIYYCDTDSLMLDMKLPVTGKNLGDWEHVGTIDELELILPKVYRAKGRFHGKKGLEEKTIYKCKGCPIERKWESPETPQIRWEAFKNYRFNPSTELARILGKDGVTGFISDIRYGSLHPRRLQENCPTCNATGVYKGVECPECGGTRYIPKPLVRALRSGDKKRQWAGFTSMPLSKASKPKGATAIPTSPQPEVQGMCKPCAGRGCSECGELGIVFRSSHKPAPPSAEHLAAMLGES